MALGLLFLRVVLGTLMAGHGAQKLFGWFGGYGLSGTGTFFEQIGFRPGRLFATAAALGEIISGVLGPALMLSVMIVATFSVHWGHGIFAASNGVEMPLIYGAGAIALALNGPGPYSLDGWLGWTGFWTPALAWTALVIGAVAASANLAIRRSSGSLQHKAA
jgi:putative oxidoreductase